MNERTGMKVIKLLNRFSDKIDGYNQVVASGKTHVWVCYRLDGLDEKGLVIAVHPSARYSEETHAYRLFVPADQVDPLITELIKQRKKMV